jgi:crotonobetainyl-CoA:carnitine CoA-transferase CaiB-like acyl-CoA transferase
MGNPDWSRDDRFTDPFARWVNREELDRLVTAWTVDYSHYEVTELLQKAGVAAMPSLSNEEIVADPHFEHRGITTTVDHPVMGEQVVFGLPWRFSKSPTTPTKASPLMGENNAYVFGELLGISSDEIARLVDQGVIH